MTALTLVLVFTFKYAGVTHIMKTCLYKVDPLKHHFNISKLGLQGSTLFFLFLHKNIQCRLWVLVRTASQMQF